MFDLGTHLLAQELAIARTAVDLQFERMAKPEYRYVHALGWQAVTVNGKTSHLWTRAEAQEFMYAHGGGEITDVIVSVSGVD